jgi:acyl carrier protein phosphodiesterase
LNYLAHLLLSHDSSECIVGNVLGDFVKGQELLALPPGIQAGVRLHRSIDSFTDSHAVTRISRARFGREWSRVSGILVDVYYDHLLASRWDSYCELTLRATLDQAYDGLRAHAHVLSSAGQYAADRLIATDLMATYTELAGIEQALTRLSRRLRNGHFHLEQSIPVFLSNRDALNEDFAQFFPELRSHASNYRE